MRASRPTNTAAPFLESRQSSWLAETDTLEKSTARGDSQHKVGQGSGSSKLSFTTAPSQMQLLHPQSSPAGAGSSRGADSDPASSAQCAQHLHGAQAFSSLDMTCVSHAMQRSGHVNKLTTKSRMNRGDLICLRIALRSHGINCWGD